MKFDENTVSNLRFFSVDSPDLSPISESGRDFRHHQVRFAKFPNPLKISHLID